ncbi:MAG: 2TM domain-containing protein [Bacteroidota bacterium]
MKPTDQHQLYEKARKRTKKKRGLYYHFVLFLIGSVFFVILNKFLNIVPEHDWFVWAIFGWLFFLIIHTLRVFVFKPFFGEEWERTETEKLLAKHDIKAEKLEKKLEKKGILSKPSKSEQIEENI